MSCFNTNSFCYDILVSFSEPQTYVLTNTAKEKLNIEWSMLVLAGFASKLQVGSWSNSCWKFLGAQEVKTISIQAHSAHNKSTNTSAFSLT